ncbi:Fe(3+)-pyochelin receptor [Pleomorphomonas sp. T1.2MG-36]|uniref:TonB-dependent siderophore receptor n=1 Tax=Pleomorphomonas sp. T1.2MG-36 TaxID=3041167 RepID=UPI00247742BA|nr:TonB-dependent siderophore receptor [Pleomorphomonas sp. T1.2MG-36]CAI9417484.1 Fe(3+)-pyochelin receptor [Pleomorphomonas sp. T1.2MG-36]
MSDYRSLCRAYGIALLATTMLAGTITAVKAQQPTAKADQAEDATELEPIVVEGATYETEGSGSYSSKLVSVGDKDTRPQREVPQSSTVVTRKRLDDGNFTSLDTVLRKTPGVVVLSNDDGRSSLYSRGFEYDYLYLNGLPTPVSSIYGTQPDMATVDHIEILRGPAGLFGGASEPSGAINMRLKQASDQYKTQVNTIFDSWKGKRVEGDITGPLNQSGSVRGRLVGALAAKDSWTDTVDNKVAVAYGTVAADITDTTTATLTINHRQRDITPFNGLPTYENGTLLDLDRSTYTGAKWNNFENNVTDYIAEVEHKFDDGGHAKVSALYSHVDVDFLYAYASSYALPNGDINGSADTRWLARDYSQDSVSLDAHVSKPFELFGQEHNIIAGADYRTTDSSLRTATGTIAGNQNIYDWNSDIAKPTVNLGPATDTDLEQWGLYGQLRVKPIDPLTLIGGGRFSWFETTSGSTSSSEKGKFTPYAGVVYDLTDAVSAYGSYTEVFQPQTATDASGALIDPRSGRQFEVGLKAELFDGVNASLALFDLTDSNRAISDPNNLGSYLGVGKAHLRGLEAELSGKVMENWEVAFGYTYTDTEYKNTTRAAGSEFYTPEHMLQLWTKYTFDGRGDWSDGLFVGGGVKVFSSFKNVSRAVNAGTGVATATAIEAPAYAVVDLQAGYKFSDNVTATLTVNNVFDEKYYERVGGTSVFNFYGEPRSVSFKLATTF